MKLVNVDEISDTTIPMMYLDYNRNDWVQCKIVTKDAPEVKAIPVEWVKKYIKDHTYEMVNPKYVDDTYNYIQFTEKPLDYNLIVMPIQVKAMLIDWEKENETN